MWTKKDYTYEKYYENRERNRIYKTKTKNDLNILFNALSYVIKKRDEEDPKRNETKKIIKKNIHALAVHTKNWLM